MPEIVATILVSAVALFVIAVFGHGMWLAAAAILRGLSGAGGEAATGLLQHCPRCGRAQWFVAGRCAVCGYEALLARPPSLENELATTARQLERLSKEGRLSTMLYEEMVGIIRAEQSRLRHEEAAATTSAGAPRREAPVSDSGQPAPPEGTPSEADAALEIEDFIERPDGAPPAVESQAEPTFIELSDMPQSSPPSGAPPERATPGFVREAEDTRTEAAQPQALADLLQRFMEERNIRWGEVISGMLIVGSAIGLVISLWATLRDAIPYFPALLFLLVTGALHLAGVYTLRRWNLKSTSRGLLIISVLLVPLSFLAAISLSQHRTAVDPLYLVSVTLGLLAFGAISISSGRLLTRPCWWPLALAVIGPSAGQLIVARLGSPGLSNARLLVLAGLPFASYLSATGAQAWLAAAGSHLTVRRTMHSFLLLGVSVFALAMPVGLLVWKTRALDDTLAALSPLVSMAATTMLAIGLVVHRRLGAATREANWSKQTGSAQNLAQLRMAGTAVTLLGAAVMLAAVVLAWPRPDLLIAVGVVNFITLTGIAFAAQLGLLHLPAVASAALVCLVGFHISQGAIGWQTPPNGYELLTVLLMGRSGAVLTVLSAVAASVGELLRRARQKTGAHAEGYLLSSAHLGAAALLVAAVAGFFTGVDQALATPVFALYAAAVLAAIGWVQRAPLTWFGCGLLLVAFWHALDWNATVIGLLERATIELGRPLVVAGLLHATIAGVLAIVHQRRSPGSIDTENRSALRTAVVAPLGQSALVTSAFVVPALLNMQATTVLSHAVYALWGAGIWMLLAFVLESTVLLSAAQALSAAGVALAVTAFCQRRPWWNAQYLDPRHLQWQAAALAVWSALWVGLRRAARGVRRLATLISADAVPVDRVVLYAVVFGYVGMLALACSPAFVGELQVVARFASGLADTLVVATFAALAIGALLAAAWTSLPERRLAGFSLALVVLSMTALTATAWGASEFHRLTGASHALAFSPGAWASLAVVGLAVACALWEAGSLSLAAALLLLLLAVPMLVAGHFEADSAALSALRWSLGLYCLAGGCMICWRRQAAEWARGAGLAICVDDEAAGALRNLLLGITFLPVLGLTLRAAVALASGNVIAGPGAGSLFESIGAAASYAGPLWLLAATLLAIAVRERRPLFALAASLTAQLGISLAYIMPRWLQALAVGHLELVELATRNALGLAAFSIVWVAVRRRLEPEPEMREFTRISDSTALRIHLGLTATLVEVVVIWAALGIVLSPGSMPRAVAQVGTWVGYTALLLTGIAWLWYSRKEWPRSAVQIASASAVGLVPVIAASLAPRNTAANWLCYHVLAAGWCAVAAISALSVLATAWPRLVAALGSTAAGATSGPGDADEGALSPQRSWEIPAVSCATFVGVFVLLLAVFGVYDDPARPWWSAAVTAVVGLAWAAVAAVRRRQAYAWLSTLCALLATTFVWLQPWILPGLTADARSLIQLMEADLVALAVAATAWLGLEVLWQRRANSVFDPHSSWPKLHRAAGLLGVLAAALLVLICLVPQLVGRSSSPVELTYASGWLIVEAMAVLLIASLWDRTASHAVGCLYALGLVALGVVLEAFELPARRVLLGGGGMVAGYVLITGLLWTLRERLHWAGCGIGIPAKTIDPLRIARWLPVCTLWLTATVVLVQFWVVLTFEELQLRMLGTAAAALLPLGIACFAIDERRDRWQWLSLMLVGVAGVDFGWTLMPIVDEPFFWLHRFIRLVVVLAAMTFLYGAVIVRFVPAATRWYRSVRRAAVSMGGAATVSLVLVLAVEAFMFEPVNGAPVTNPQIGAVAVVLVGMAIGLVSLAVLPGADPLSLTHRGRTAYVYAAELVMLLLFVHVYLTIPGLFRGYLLPYWPFIVMGIAFFGATIGELFERLEMPVLSEPLQRTGAMLPLLPALGFWVRAGASDYSTVLFVVGLLYVVLAMWRKSFIYSAAAALAGNGALWALLHEHGLSILARPQMWLIPPALSVLAAAQVNRSRLSDTQLTGIRYLAVMVIYASSTGEMFIVGVGESIMLPIVLGLLSVMGVFLGILLRVRAFLYLGSSFLLLSLVSMVWHAAQNIGHVWPWWAFGIALGLAILTLFGLFEKKRNDMLDLIADLRQWEK